MATKAQILNSKLSGSKRSISTYKFPLDLETEGSGDIMLININVAEGSKYLGKKYKKVDGKPAVNESSSNSLRSKVSNQTVRIDTSIALFMPNNINSSYSSNWSTTELGSIGSVADAFTGAGELTMERQAQLWDIIKRSSVDVATNTLAGTTQALTPVNVKDLKNLVTSQVSNPYVEVLFNSVDNRTFNFTFKMIPRSKKEADEIKNICDTLKFHQAPELKYDGQNNYLLFPSTFDINFINNQGERNPYIFKVSTCALTNVSINHTTEGNWIRHEDGSPFATELSLSFTELEVLTKERIEEGY